MRYFLGVHKYAPTAAVQGDMGWISLKYRRYVAMLKFWNRLVHMDNTRLTKQVFLWCYDNPVNNWCDEIRKIAETFHVEHTYATKGIFKIDDIIQKCSELMLTEWRHQILTKPKLRTYTKFKTEFVVEPYITRNVPKYSRSLYAQFRSGILPLHIETGRYANIRDPHTGKHRKMSPNERLCNICKFDHVEDEKHFILICNKYEEERNTLFQHCSQSNDNFRNLTEDEKFTYIIKNEWRAALNYITDAWMKRKECLYV